MQANWYLTPKLLGSFQDEEARHVSGSSTRIVLRTPSMAFICEHHSNVIQITVIFHNFWKIITSNSGLFLHLDAARRSKRPSSAPTPVVVC